MHIVVQLVGLQISIQYSAQEADLLFLWFSSKCIVRSCIRSINQTGLKWAVTEGKEEQ